MIAPVKDAQPTAPQRVPPLCSLPRLRIVDRKSEKSPTSNNSKFLTSKKWFSEGCLFTRSKLAWGGGSNKQKTTAVSKTAGPATEPPSAVLETAGPADLTPAESGLKSLSFELLPLMGSDTVSEIPNPDVRPSEESKPSCLVRPREDIRGGRTSEQPAGTGGGEGLLVVRGQKKAKSSSFRHTFLSRESTPVERIRQCCTLFKQSQENNSKSFSIPRPSLTRSVSAAASIGRRLRSTHSKNKSAESKSGGLDSKSVESNAKNAKKKHECKVSPSSDDRGDSKKFKMDQEQNLGKPNKTALKIERLRKTIEDQQDEIIALQEALKSKSSNLEIDQEVVAGNDMEQRSESFHFFESKPRSIGQPSSLGHADFLCLGANRREMELEAENEMLREELQEAKDHSELLEFRILEFTEGIQRATGGVHDPTCDRGTCTSTDDVTIPVFSLPPPSAGEDFSLTMSLDSGLELNLDHNLKSRLLEYRNNLSRLEEASGISESAAVANLTLLLDWAESMLPNNYESLPNIMNFRSSALKKHEMASDMDDQCLDVQISSSDLAVLAAKLQDTLANPKEQEEVLQEAVTKLRTVNVTLCRLQARVSTLIGENKDLQEALAALHEAHETRTEASGTESELVNVKTPSLHSDLSDAESDESPRPTKALESTPTFQESGIFLSSSDMISSATQTPQTIDPRYLLSSFKSSETIMPDLPRDSELEKAEVDLQTALARLTSIRNTVQGGKCIRSLRVQDLQESEDFLMEAGNKVTLCKMEYDALVATERELQREIESLRFEREELLQKCAHIDRLRISNAALSDKYEVLRAELRLQDERLEISERLRRQFFDEKCEIEEAENDARLLAQRLESQLEAAREMEALLSASLSQEQEFCRELQRRVKELQLIDKGRRIHQEALEREIISIKQKDIALMEAIDCEKYQLTFTLYGLLFTQVWRRLASINHIALVPFNPKTKSENECLQPWFSDLSGRTIVNYTDWCNKCSYTDLTHPQLVTNNFELERVTSVEESVQPLEVADIDIQFSDINNSLEEPQAKRLRSSDMSSQVIMLDNENGLSDRESFYLAQIQTLQLERKCLRDGFETAQSGSIRELQAVQSDVSELRHALKMSQQDNCNLLFKLEESHEAVTEAETEFQKQLEELKKDFNLSLEVYQSEQRQLEEHYKDRLIELKKSSDLHEQRFAALLQQYSVLQHELEPYIQKVNSRMVEDEETPDGHSSAKISTTKDLLSAVRELIRSEIAAKQKITELENKESAYRETIDEADRIMSNHVTAYTARIEELESTVEQKVSKILQLENSEERLMNTLKNSWKSGEGPRISDLLDRLIVTENSELNLKERVWNLERNGKELQIKIVEAEKAQENLKTELRDQEELVQRLMTLTKENNALSTQLQETHEAMKRISDSQQSEKFLKSRIEELESSETSLKDLLKETEQMMTQRDRKFRDQITNLESEIGTLRDQLEAISFQSQIAKETESTLRHQVEDFRSQVHTLKKELNDASSESSCYESQYRLEVTKLRSQLKLANTQLNEFDILNGELKERAEATEAATKEVVLRLEERSRRHESEVLALNLELTQKDSKIDEFEAQIQQLTHANVVGELDYLATSPLVQLQTALEQFIKDSKNCEQCNSQNKNQLEGLRESLKALKEVLDGRSQSDSDSDETESKATSISSPSHDDNLSGDEEGYRVACLPFFSSKLHDRVGVAGTLESFPAIPPRPRRDAKRRRRIPKAKQQEASLKQELEEQEAGSSVYRKSTSSFLALEELKEKVKELEQVVAQKEEELRIADIEAAEMQSLLLEEDKKLTLKNVEVQKTNSALMSLREQLLVTVEEYERVRHIVEAKHKKTCEWKATFCEKRLQQINGQEESSLTDLAATEGLKAMLTLVSRHGRVKDRIIHTLVKQLKAILGLDNMKVVVTQIQQLDSVCEKMEAREGDDLAVPDYDVQLACQMLEDVSLVDEALADSLGFKPLQTLASSGRYKPSSSATSSRHADSAASHSLLGVTLFGKTACLPPLSSNKSRIPRARPLSVPSLKHDDFPVERESVVERALNSLSSRARGAKSKQESLKPLAKVVPKQRPFAKVLPKAKVLLSSSSLDSRDQKQTSEEGSSSGKFISDARKVKRMVTGLKPVNAEVDCSSAPEYSKQNKPPKPTCVPKPENLRITRKVGVDGVVIAWTPLEHDCVVGFQVIVGGIVVQQVRSPHRTKALVTGLPFPSPFTIGLVAVAEDGRCSSPTLVTSEESQLYKSAKLKRSASCGDATGCRSPKKVSLPTCL